MKNMDTSEKSGELGVVTKVKALVAYIMDTTEKAPKEFRVVYVNRLQNYALDILENIVAANFTQLKDDFSERKRLQKQAFVELKVLCATAFTAMQAKAIKQTHYLNMSKLAEEASTLLIAWGKSDDKRSNAL
jgi:tryptophan 2,3-dioxygenase